MLKLIIIIPAYNEEKSITQVIKSIPRQIPLINKVEVLVINDCSTDKTAKQARKAGADYIISNKKNLGLGKSFEKALQYACYKLSADIIVNTDADNQYDQTQIPTLIKPIIENKVDMVIGNRQVKTLKWMSWTKKYGNLFGDLVVSFIVGQKIKDASTGFRALSYECAKNIYLLSGHTYTHDMIIQAIKNDFIIDQIDITFKPRLYGNSKLILNIANHIFLSLVTIVRSIFYYSAFKFCSTISIIFLSAGFILGLRFIFFYIKGFGEGHIQSIILSAILIIIGINIFVFGIIADLISYNRKVIKSNLILNNKI